MTLYVRTYLSFFGSYCHYFQVFDEATIKTVVTEIKLLKDLKDQPDTGKHRNKEKIELRE